MKLLVITQKVDKEDPVLGFFHNWLIRLGEKFESLVVICLEEGAHNLPSNIKVLSLGKDLPAGRQGKYLLKLKYVVNFYKYIWRERNNYDAVFVHMNQEYIILGWKMWFLLRKKIYLWRNHREGNFFTRIAVLFSNKVFYTSPDSFTARFKRAIKMPVGIDTEIFKPGRIEEKRKNSILFLGRIAPVKNVRLFVEALKILKEKEVQFEANIYGDALLRDEKYFEDIKRRVGELNLNNAITFHNSVSNYKTPEIYNDHQIFVNLTPSGSFDKTILEAAACGCIPIITNKSLESVPEFSYLLSEPNAGDIADKITLWLEANELTTSEKTKNLRTFIEREHSLINLTNKLHSALIHFNNE